MKKRLALLLTLLLALTVLVSPALGEGAILTRLQAAVMLDELFALADVHPLAIPAFETTPKNLGYTASNGAIATANVIAAAKDCVTFEAQPQIEAVINAGLMALDSDGLSFRPSRPMTGEAFALAIAKGLYGADLPVDHLALALADGVFVQEQLTNEPLTVELAEAMTAQVADRLQLAAIFATSDIHGNYIPYTSSDGRFQIGSVARIKTILDETRRELGAENVLYVDGGDSPYNTTLANVSMGNVSVDALSALGLDATVLGNHDFDYSLENLLRLRDRAQYAMLSANTKFKEGKAYAGEKEYPFGDYITKEAAGLKFGIFGVTDDQSAATTLYSNTYDIEWDDDLTTAKTLVGRLKDEESCDVLRFFTKLKGKLMPYLFAQAVKTHTTGIPMMRPMVMDYTDDIACRYLDQQYMLGDNLLCAPVFREDGVANFYLPEGKWYDIITGKTYEGGKYHAVTCTFMEMPVLAKPNSIVAFGAFENQFEYDYLSGADFCICNLEDGKSASASVYDTKANLVLTLTATRKGNTITIESGETDKTFTVSVAGTDKKITMQGGKGEIVL